MMKCIPLAAGLLALSAGHPSGAQEPAGSKTTTPPPAAAPQLEAQPEEVLATHSQPLGERQLIVQKLTPRELPPLPSAEPATVLGKRAAASLASRAEAAEKPAYIFVSATVHLFRQQPDQPRSLVRFWLTPEAAPVTVWTNANFLWLLGGFSSLDAEGRRFHLLPTVSTEQWERPGSTVMRRGQTYSGLKIPAFADETTASFVVAEGNPTEDDLAPLRALLAHYNAHRAQLRADYEARTALGAEQAQERAANPSEKKHIVVKYWRLDPAGQTGKTTQPATR